MGWKLDGGLTDERQQDVDEEVDEGELSDDDVGAECGYVLLGSHLEELLLLHAHAVVEVVGVGQLQQGVPGRRPAQERRLGLERKHERVVEFVGQQPAVHDLVDLRQRARLAPELRRHSEREHRLLDDARVIPSLVVVPPRERVDDGRRHLHHLLLLLQERPRCLLAVH